MFLKVLPPPSAPHSAHPKKSKKKVLRMEEMFEGHSADKGAGKLPLVPMGGRAEGLACADPGARTPIGASGNCLQLTLSSE